MQLLRWIPFLVLSQRACALPEDAASDAVPSPPSCDALSKTRLYMVLEQINYSAYWIYSTPAHLAVSQAAVSFSVENNLVGAPIKCSATNGVAFSFFDGNQAYKCDTSKLPSAMAASMSFTFSTSTSTFGITASWACNDSRSRRM
jgi:hypothetical protein